MRFISAVLFCAAFCVFTACSPEENDDILISYNFTSDLEGWSIGTSGKQVDDVSWVDWGGDPPGCVKMDGSDFGTSDHLANSWIYKELTLDENHTTLTFLTSTHDRANANAELRVRLIDANQNNHILIDWELGNPGVEDELVWIEKTADLSNFAGQTITLFFEQGDNDIGVHEQRYLDRIRIK